MDFSWTDQQIELRRRAIAFAREQLDPGTAERDATESFSPEAWKAAAEFGVLGSFVPEAYGGRGWDVLTTILVMEAIGYGCRDNGLTLGLNGQMWSIQEPLLRFGSEEQKKQYLPLLCSGDWLGAHGMTESGSGSDAFSLQTTAEKDGDTYVLNGHKVYIGLAPVADLCLVFANSNPAMGRWGISVFLVEAAWDGVELSPARQTLGLKTAQIGEIRLTDCRVPESSRLGPEGVGISLFNASMDWERSFIFASHVGSMARQLDDCIAFAKERQQFGQAIGSFQSVSNRIADMKLRLETCQLLLYKLAWMKERDDPAALDAAMANLHLAESFMQSSIDAMRIHGARGYMAGGDPERDVRDSLGGVLYSGTSDIQRNIIAQMLGL